MELYHASSKQYSIGDIIDAETFVQTLYYTNTNHKWVDELLDEYRPAEYPSRKKTLYAFKKMQHCLAFVNKNLTEQHFFYKVEMEKAIPCPMYLTDGLKSFDKTKHGEIAKEYWNSTHDWKYLEYLCQKMVILEQVILPSNNIEKIALSSSGLEDYVSDKELFKSAFT